MPHLIILPRSFLSQLCSGRPIKNEIAKIGKGSVVSYKSGGGDEGFGGGRMDGWVSNMVWSLVYSLGVRSIHGERCSS